MQLAVIGSYSKANERRVPLHPDHLSLIPESLRSQILFDRGYGLNFGVSDDELASLCGGVVPRQELLSIADAVVLLKPLAEDMKQFKDGAILWGWPHCVQQSSVVQTAIDKRLTIIAMERMFPWGPDGERGQHIFYKNGELAGVAAVHHSFNLTGIDGSYGPPLSAVIIGTGSSSRGAIYALKGRGVNQITVCENRPDYKAKDHMAGCEYFTLKKETMTLHQNALDKGFPLSERLYSADIIINAVFQDPNSPLNYLNEGDEKHLKQGALILDISCDEGMGFPFAVPTSFDKPILEFDNFMYYAVDHMPTLLWKSSSWTVSEALLPYLEPMIKESWHDNLTLFKSLDIEQGTIVDPAILRFQNRERTYPHHYLSKSDK